MTEELAKAIAEANGIIRENLERHGSPLITNYLQNVERYWDINPFFYDKAKIFWLWNKQKYCWEMVDETDILVSIDKELRFMGQLVTNGMRMNYLEAFKQYGRTKIPLSGLKDIVQFKNMLFHIPSKKIISATPKLFCCNPIPYEIGKSTETPVMDKLFVEWVGEKYKDTLYEIIAYCCLSDYPIHSLFCLVGSGRNGKSQYQKVIQKFFGMGNICSTELDLLIDNRFESAKLYKKLVCTLGETNFGVMAKTSLLKKLTGGDLIGYEFKNKLPFDDLNYAKIIINSNALPSSLDTSDGFYRRWLIINFPNEFSEGKEIVETIPEDEYNNLVTKVLLILPELLTRGTFTNQGTIEERRKAYIMASNPLPFFIDQFCCKESDRWVKHTDLYNAYTHFLLTNKKRKVSRKEFNEILNEEGLFSTRSTKTVETMKNGKFGDNEYLSGYFIDGIDLLLDWKTKVELK